MKRLPTPTVAWLVLALLGMGTLIGLGIGEGGTSSPPARRVGATAVVEVRNLHVTSRAGEASLSWEVSSTTNVLHILVEQKLGAGAWTKYPELPPSARSDTLTSLPTGAAAFRVWAVLKQGNKEASTTIPAPPPPPPPVEPEPPVEPPPASGLQVGLNAGYWGSSEPPELASIVKYVRLDTPPNISPWTKAGLKVIADESGPYSSSGVSGVNVTSYVAHDVAFVKENPEVADVETLNEPGGEWFWGGSAESSTNRTAYANLVIAVHNALVSNFGAKAPPQLCSYDGGHDSSTAWGEAWTQNKTALADCDMLTVHPYGGTGSRASASLGNRALVEAAHSKTGKPIAITEVGFPTKGPTGDSLQYTPAEQASSITGIVRWARSTGYVKLILIYGYRDGQPGGGYGVATHEDEHKPAWAALAQAAAE